MVSITSVSKPHHGVLITNRFLSSGRHINAEGEYSTWWTEETKSQYEKRSQCFIEQYSNYTFDKTDETVSES